MIKRYRDKEIDKIWDDGNKLALWQKTELAVIQTMVKLGKIEQESYQRIFEILKKNPIDIDWWKRRDKETKHDLNAFLDERLRFLPNNLQKYLHKKITSYDTEEPAFARMLIDSLNVIINHYQELIQILEEKAIRYRYTIMNGRTHGQEAELQSLGKRDLTSIAALRVDFETLKGAMEKLKYSKLSGAMGNYGSIDPKLEKGALKILGFEPFYGATQIMPREIYAPIAQALSQLVLTLAKIAVTIRLGARSGRPIYQEPFSKKQKGSSTMPHKRNTIFTEQLEGMERMAEGYSAMITKNIMTWEERAIEQSSVERVAWPDLFHVTIRSLKVAKRVFEGLMVYPDQMLLEIIDSRGCYASSEAKETLKELGIPFGLSVEESYRIVQLAAFNAFHPGEKIEKIRKSPCQSFTEADKMLADFQQMPRKKVVSIREIITQGYLEVSPQLEAKAEVVQKWNQILRRIFSETENLNRWNQIFLPSYLLRNEKKVYQEILGI